MEVTVDHFHDAELKCFYYNRGQRTLDLEFMYYDDSTLTIAFAGVHSFRLSGDSGQNVVLSLRTSAIVADPIRDGLDRNAIQNYVEWIGAESSSVRRQTIVERVLNGNVVLLAMASSIGLEFAVLSRSYTLACTCNRHMEPR